MNSVEMSANQRNESRFIVPELSVAIRSQQVLHFTKYKSCNLVDINRGGIGVVSNTLNLNEAQKVDIQLCYKNEKFLAKGIIGYQCEKNRRAHYGIIFFSIPYEFERLLEDWYGESSKAQSKTSNAGHNTHQQDSQGLYLVSGTQRRLEPRIDASSLTAKIGKASLLVHSNFDTCRLSFISMNSVSLYSEDQFELADKVRLEVLCDEYAYRVDGVITYVKTTQDQFLYGIEFTSVPPRFTHLIEKLHDDAYTPEGSL